MGKSIIEELASSYEEAKGFVDRTFELLEDWRAKCMVYSHKEKDGYLVDALTGTEGTLGVEVAAALSVMMPAREEDKETRTIFVTDHPDLDRMPAFMELGENGWRTKAGAVYVFIRGRTYQSNDIIVSFDDDRYLIILRRAMSTNDILMDIYKK